MLTAFSITRPSSRLPTSRQRMWQAHINIGSLVLNDIFNDWTKAGSMFCKRLCNKLVRFSRLPQGRHASASNAGPEWALRSLILQHCPKIGTQRSHCAQSHVGRFPCCLLLFYFKKERNKQNTMDTGYLMTKLNNWWVEICKEILLTLSIL